MPAALKASLNVCHAAEILVDLGFQLAGILPPVGAHVLPEQDVVPMLAGIVEHRRQVRLVVGDLTISSSDLPCSAASFSTKPFSAVT